MYTEWSSLTPQITSNVNGSQQLSTLNKFNALISRDVTSALVKQLSGNLGITQKPEPSPFQTDQEVAWCMDVICFGLSLPLADHETIKDCVNVYCEWLTCLLPSPKVSVPKPIIDDPNVYTHKIISHLHNLFVPRQGEGIDVINRQTVLCHRVLRTLQNVAQNSQVLTRETWESLLLFLLAINQVLLSPPTVKDDVGDQLCERVLSVLFEVWLLACVKCFPSPSLWKTFQESCASWRHRIALVEQWNRVNIALTARLLDFTYGSSFPELKIPDEDNQLIPQEMTNDCIAQSWYRFLRMIGSPIALCCPQVISHTPQFMQYILLRDDSIEPHQHPCLLMLPQIFLKAMKGVASQVDAFLGIFQPVVWEQGIIIDNTLSTTNQSNTSGAQQRHSGGSALTRSAGAEQSLSSSSNNNSVGVGSRNLSGDGVLMMTSDHHQQSSPTPPLQRRLAKSFSVAPSQSHSKGLSKGSLISLTSSRSTSISTVMGPNSGPPSAGSLTSILSISNENRSTLASSRPKCNSILHLFGEWLFDAAHIGSDMWLQSLRKQATEASRRPSSMIIDQKRGLSISQPSSLESEMPNGLTIDKYESGKAESIGALCRIFCAKKTNEEILPVYLARFYLALQQGLKVNEKNKEVEETLASILFNSSDIFRLDLDGVMVLLPHYITALELVLPEKDLKIKSHNLIFNKTDLRRASIQILLSILALPLHFQSLPIRDITGGAGDKVISFGQLKSRLINVMMSALQVETDSQNTHMLLGGLLLCVQDSVLYEEFDSGASDSHSTSARETNLLSSACSERSAYSVASGASNSSYGNSSTATVSNEPTSLMSDDLMPEDLEAGAYDNAHALFVRATYLSCHRLISSWKTDLNVSLAALELLSGLARMNIKESDALECKRAVKWICDYICYQCSRPPPCHSKDLHSTIVAAFQCTAVWLMQHPFLLQDKDSLTTVLEVVELGISGVKSVGKLGEAIKMKDEKELKPVSMRVRDAAETLLTIILEQVGYFPNACGIQSISSLLDEVTLIKHCNTGGNLTHEQAVQKFRYFVTENSTVLAILDEQLGNDQDPQPTVTLLMRTPHGRHTWTAQLRHLPRSKSGTKYHAVNPGRPIPMNDMPMRHEIEPKFFPDTVDPARLFLSHFGFLSIGENVHQKANEQSLLSPSLIVLDSKKNGFVNDLDVLDKMSPRTCDTVHIFYVRVGQSMEQEIVENMSEDNIGSLDVNFWSMLQSLGQTVDVDEHCGWTGFINSSWRVNNSKPRKSRDGRGAAGSDMNFNGEKKIIYWADVSSEIAFVVPNRSNRNDIDSSDGSCLSAGQSNDVWYERSVSELQKSEKVPLSKNPRALSLDNENLNANRGEPVAPARRRTGANKPIINWTPSAKIMLVWLESFEDYLTFPTDDLLNYTRIGDESHLNNAQSSADCHIIFLHALNSGLLRVKLQAPQGRINFATPLVDGMIVSKRVIGSLVRQTAYNMAKRKRLDSDSYQPPHVRRRLKVQEMIQRYKLDLTEPELLTNLFINN
ncbi:CLUMA_CG013983, isoform A [Clunio marinus]|uniref:CLUMA_CG013983, isoform A n=1 Tax=Clunio marinus TaxID=568069 RepID=A0A1J1INQ4_9DIPT|nr:CLUMA_CG013983, isoform A [Clunio marinus]